jgi:rRNA maturation endonuclease Nob1
MERLSQNTIRKVVEGKTVYQVVIDGNKYQECSECGEYFKITGYNSKYCPSCAKKINIKKTSEKNKERYYATKAEQEQE